MITTGRTIENGDVVRHSVCIVGGGAAGITIARELSGRGRDICMLESGDLDFDVTDQDLYQAERLNPIFPDTTISRLRFFGGSTNHWEGACHPFSEADFEVRSWVPHSGWPFSLKDLDPYYERAHVYCELGEYNYDVGDWAARTSLPLIDFDENKAKSKIQHYSTPTQFGWVYREDLEQDPFTKVYLDSNVVSINVAETGERITSVTVQVLDGARFTIEADLFVLATGGIENARILLASDAVHKNGLGNTYDVVGRYFMEHPIVEGAELYLTGGFDPRFYEFFFYDDRSHLGYLSLSEEVAKKKQLNNIKVALMEQSRYYLSKGISSFNQITEDLKGGEIPDNLWTHAGNIFQEIDMVGEAVYRKLFKSRLLDYSDDMVGYVFDTMIEQTPDKDNRIGLTGERDPLGMQKASIEWSVSERDYENMWRCYEVLAEEVGRLGIGRLQLQRNNKRLLTSQLSFGHHHMGTTRAGTNPRDSVVDGNFKMHDIANLFVAGSSSFPTGGHVPPTLTIVATSIRLSDHLKTLMGGAV